MLLIFHQRHQPLNVFLMETTMPLRVELVMLRSKARDGEGIVYEVKVVGSLFAHEHTG